MDAMDGIEPIDCRLSDEQIAALNARAAFAPWSIAIPSGIPDEQFSRPRLETERYLRLRIHTLADEQRELDAARSPGYLHGPETGRQIAEIIERKRAERKGGK